MAVEIDPKLVARLRQDTGAGMMDCKRALGESAGDFEKAKDHLRKRGMDIATKKGSRETKNGWVGSYIHHNGRVGVMVEILCETDFVARTPEFHELIKDLAMQVAMTDPLALRREDVPAHLVEKEKEIYGAQLPADKPPAVRQKILEGKLDAFFKERCLLEQPFIKDQKLTIKDLVQAKVQKTGENIVVGRFARFEIGK